MAFRVATAVGSAGMNTITGQIDLHTPPGKLYVRTGSQPSTVESTDTGTLLANPTFGNPSFGAASSGVSTANAITSDTNAANSGTAGYFVIKDAALNHLFDGTCGQGSGDLSFDNNVIVAGGTVAITSFTMTLPTS